MKLLEAKHLGHRIVEAVLPTAGRSRLAFRLAPLIQEVAEVSTQRKRLNLTQQNKKSSDSALSALSGKLGIFGENSTLDVVGPKIGI